MHNQHDEPSQQSTSSQRLNQLKIDISLSTPQLRELVLNEEKLTAMVNKLNTDGSNYILQEHFNEAIIYLNEAERILEYAASYGKKIDRNVIIMTLHNQACAFQRLWHLDKTMNYLDGIIYNFISYFEHEPKFNITSEIFDPNSKLYQTLSIYLDRKNKLAVYYLQYCAVNSQSKKHQIALQNALKALKILSQVCQACMYIETLSSSTNIYLYNSLHKANYQIDLKQYDRIFKLTKVKMYKFNQTLKQQHFHPLKMLFENFSIASLMQIQPLMHHQRGNCLAEIQQKSKYEKVLNISIALFTLGTQYRLLANVNHQLSEKQKKLSEDYKKSEIYYLLAITTMVTHIPFQTSFLKHVLKTYNSYFMFDFNKIQTVEIQSQYENDYEYIEPNKGKIIETNDEGSHQQKVKRIYTTENENNLPMKSYLNNKNKNNLKLSLEDYSPIQLKKNQKKKKSQSKIIKPSSKKKSSIYSSDKLLNTKSKFKRMETPKGNQGHDTNRIKQQYMIEQPTHKSKSKNKIKKVNPTTPRSYHLASNSSHKNNLNGTSKDGSKVIKAIHSPTAQKKLIKSSRSNYYDIN